MSLKDYLHIFSTLRARSLIGVIAAASLVACSSGGGGNNGGNAQNSSTSSSANTSSSSSQSNNFDTAAMIGNLADSVIIPNHQSLSAKAQAFNAESGPLALYCHSTGDADLLANAQNAWVDLMATWQQTELLQIGPITANGNLLHDRIYIYGETSRVNSCNVDKNVINAFQNDSFNISTQLFSSRGLGALEYLLFGVSLNHSCAESDVTAEEWTALNNWNSESEENKRIQRCAYAQTVLADVDDAAQSLTQEWTTASPSARSELVSANAQSVLQALSNALFYIEKTTKDLKLGSTTGLKADACDTFTCPGLIESPYSQTSLENIHNNLIAFWDLYSGNEGLGFDDLISAAGMASINQAFEADVTAAINYVDQLITANVNLVDQVDTITSSGSLSACSASATDPETTTTVEVCSLHGLIKRISDRLRTDFVTVVNVDLPASAQSDAD